MCDHTQRGSDRRNPGPDISRRGFLVGAGGVAALGTVAASGATEPRGGESPTPKSVPGKEHPPGRPLRVKPTLIYGVPTRAEKTSWRSYGGVQTKEEARSEGRRIEKELTDLKSRAEFPVEVLPLAIVDSDAKMQEVITCDCDLVLLYAAGGPLHWVHEFEKSKAPMLMFVRHRSGPFYLWYEIAHWRFLRRNGDTFQTPHYDVDDVVVDDYTQMLWRLRAYYGLKNARGTTMLAIGGLAAYSAPAQERGPKVAREVWGYNIKEIRDDDFAQRLGAARNDAKAVEDAERQTDELLATPNLWLATERRFVTNTFLALAVCKQLMRELGATNFGFAQCMGRHIQMLDTPPCLMLSLANDEGYTAYCHTDLSHTMPGVLLRWIAGRPTFVCNTHFPHDGIFTVAHCQAPRKMNGRDYEPATIMTHFESDYGAACKTHYTKGQTVTVIVPNLHCTKWFGFRGKVLDSPSYPACRSQMEIQIDGDWRSLLQEMEGFHSQVVYGDYVREVGYALKKLGGQIEWHCYSETS